ncbi:hypothetical protein EGW08_008636 [Elysia chlorotica]|uniref:Senescence domain-containing protein n=1 Tax=Elysia chlorotica TaxID=188477 RepID=A0A433TPQ6_ELYCH|nr:hypothetical protein EGW08_008636 [Elysia chlorotica]
MDVKPSRSSPSTNLTEHESPVEPEGFDTEKLLKKDNQPSTSYHSVYDNPDPSLTRGLSESFPDDALHQTSSAESIEDDDYESFPTNFSPKTSTTKLSMAKSKSSKTVTFVDATGAEIEESAKRHTASQASSQVAASRVFSIEDSVQVFYVDCYGRVNAEEATSALHLVRLHPRTDVEMPKVVHPSAFLHVSITNIATFNIGVIINGGAVGAMFRILDLLCQVVKTLVWFILVLAEYGVWFIRTMAAFIRSRARRASHQHRVDPNILQGVLYAKSASNRGVILTNQVVANLHEATMNLSRLIAPRPSAFMPSPIKETQLGTILTVTAEVGATAFGGALDIYTSLADAGNMLVEAVSEETVKTMEHKYGSEYGALVKEAFIAALNVNQAFSNTSKITSLAFVPNTIHIRIKERLGSSSDVALRSEERSGSNNSSEENLHRRKNKTERSKHKDTDSQQSEDNSTSLRKIRRREDKSKWNWSSPNLHDQAVLESRIRSDSESSYFSDLDKILRPTSNGVLAEDTQGTCGSFESDITSQTFINVIQPSQGQSTNFDVIAELEKETEQISNDTSSIPPEQSFISSSITDWCSKDLKSYDHSQVPSRADSFASITPRVSTQKSSGGSVGPLRRLSVYLSRRRQSLHIHAAMARAVERQFSTPDTCSLLGDCQGDSHLSRFYLAATSVTRAKIRRKHREKADEKFLVVVRLTSNLYVPGRSSDT